MSDFRYLFEVYVPCQIDLAGSENAKMANTNAKADRGREGKHINQSLLALSTVIQRLSEEKAGGQKQHIPYRDSKLTRST